MDEHRLRRDDDAMDALQAVVVGGIFLLAGSVKGITGMGLPTVAISLLGLWMPPWQAASLLVVPSLATNVAQCWGAHARMLIARLWPSWVALAVVTVWAPEMGSLNGVPPAHRLLGGVLVLYGLWGLWRPTLPVLPSRVAWLGVPVGAVTGLLAASTAVFVIPLVPYLQALRLDKEATVQALGLSFTVATLALAARLHGAGSLVVWSALSFVALSAAFMGLWLGTHIRTRISGALFQRGLFVAFVGLGLANLSRGS